jgi:hypothetical protein
MGRETLVVPARFSVSAVEVRQHLCKVLPALAWTRHASMEGDYLRGSLDGTKVRVLVEDGEVEIWPHEAWHADRVASLVAQIVGALSCITHADPGA